MTTVIIPKRRKERGGTAAALVALNEVLMEREWCIETDTGRTKIGDGVTAWNDLPYSNPMLFAAASGSDTLTATYNSTPVYHDGLHVALRAAAANTGAVTFNPNGLGALAVTKFGGVALSAGDIYGAGHELLLRYRESVPRWELLNPAATGAAPGSGEAIEITISQTAHGLSEGMPIYYDGAAWAAADRDDEAKAAEGVVSEVVNANSFVVTLAGQIVLTTGQWDARTGGSGGLTAGEYYWLGSTAGGLTSTRPDAGVQVVLKAWSATEAMVTIGDYFDTAETTETYTSQTVTAASTSPTAASGMHVIICDATLNAIAVNLPSAANNTAIYIIKKIDASANAVTIDPSGAQTIDGSTTATISTRYESRTLVSDGSNWHVV